jgi:hypothetical protein
MNINSSFSRLAGVALAIWLTPFAAMADSGFYIGGAAGAATVEANFGDTGIPGFPASIDEDDTAYKFFAGYNFDLPVIDLGIEAGYVDFGAPEINVLGDQFELDPTGINVWGIASLGLGPVDVHAKVGYLAWDVDATAFGQTESDDGSDLGYGVGLSFGLAGIRIRGEYELYDLDDADLSMLSIGILYQFN